MKFLSAFLFEGWDSFRVTAGVTCYYDVCASPASNSYPELAWDIELCSAISGDKPSVSYG